MTGWQNLKYLASLSGGITNKEIEEAVDLVQMKGRIDSLFKTYSLGMKQRIGIAQAIMHHRVGDVVTVASPNGQYDVQILAIS